MKYVGDNAFSASQELKTVTLPAFPDVDPVSIQSMEDMPIHFGKNVFANTGIDHFCFPDWMVIVPEGIFRQETSRYAYSLNIGTWRLSMIDDYPSQMHAQTDITLAPGTKEVGPYAFYNNLMLQMPEPLPQSIKHYGNSCFQNAGKNLGKVMVENPDGSTTATDEELYFSSIIAADDCVFDSNCLNAAKLRAISFSGCAEFGYSCFANMTYLKSIIFPECLTEIPSGFCKDWSSLESVGFQNNKVVKIGFEAFSGCSKLSGALDLSAMADLVEIAGSAFKGSGITSLLLPDNGARLSLGASAFQQTPIDAIHIPACVESIGASCFEGCNLTHQLTFAPRTADLAIGNQAFYSCSNIPALNLPATNVTIGDRAFSYCSKLTDITWPTDPYTVSLGIYAFQYCNALVEITTPASVGLIPQGCFANCNRLRQATLTNVYAINSYSFNQCTSLEEVTMERADKFTVIGANAFEGTSNLKTLNTAIAPKNINGLAFKNSGIQTWNVADVEANSPMETIHNEAFVGCKNLQSFPAVLAGSTVFKHGIFRGCQSLRSVAVPSFMTNETSTSNSYYYSYRFDGATKLQSIEFLSPDRGVQLYMRDYQNAPMQALSFMRGEVQGGSTTMLRGWTNYPNQASRNGSSIPLMCDRGQKYKLVEGGLEKANAAGRKFFDIREIKNPQLALHGEIFSTFNVGADVNDYTGVLRWQMELSDLDSEKPTEYELWRDGSRVATFMFDAPELLPSGVSDGAVSTSAPAWAVAFRVYDPDGNDITDRMQYGDFYFEFEPGKYTSTIQTAQTKVYFNGASTARIGQAEKFGRESWFLYKDHFQSPKLEGVGIPTSHTYVLRMKNYDYLEPENYPDLQPDEQGKYFRDIAKRTGLPGHEWMESEPCTVHTSIAHPSIGIEGLYSEQEVREDFERDLAVTTVAEGATYALTYNVAGGTESHKLFTTPTSSTGQYIVKSVQAHRLDSRSASTSDDTRWGEAQTVAGQSNGVLTGPETDVIPGVTTFQTVTDAGHRGTFGSPKVTLYGAPSHTFDVSHESQWHWHGWLNRGEPFRLYLAPMLEEFGYPQGQGLEEGKYYIGIWRKVKVLPKGSMPYNAPSNTYDASEEIQDPEPQLVWHSDGFHPAERQETCDKCQETTGFDHETLSFSDHAPVPMYNPSLVTYTTRLYVQKPDDPTKYAVSEAVSEPTLVAEITTGIEMDTTLSPSQIDQAIANGLLFNVAGRRIAAPAPGEIFVAVWNGKIYKLRR